MAEHENIVSEEIFRDIRSGRHKLGLGAWKPGDTALFREHHRGGTMMAEHEVPLNPETFRGVRSGRHRSAFPLKPGDRVLYREIEQGSYTGRWLVSEVEAGDPMGPPRTFLRWPPAASHDVPEPRA